MSLARTALRLAVIAALEADATVAAFCVGRIFDSRIEEIDAKEVAPIIIVFTGDEHGKAWSANNGGPPFDSAVDLNLEISMRIQASADGADVPDIGVPEIDSELEAALDLIEDAAVAAIAVGDTPASILVRQVLRRITEHRSVRYASADTGAKLAMRLVTLTAEMNEDDGQQSPFDGVPTGPFAALPEPLRTVASSLPAGSDGLATCQALVAKLTAPVAAQPFTGAASAVYAPQRLRADRVPSPTDPNVPTFGQEIDIHG